MSKRKLRIYFGPEDRRDVVVHRNEAESPHRTVTVPLGELVEALVHARMQGRHWIEDFREDEVTVSTDLYEIILAYQYYHRPSA